MLAVESLCDKFTLDDFSMRTQPFIRLHHFSAKREIYLRNLQIWVDEELVSCSRIKCLLWKFWIPENHNQVSLMRGKIPLRSDGIEMVCLFAIGREQSAKTTMTHWMYTLNHGERYHICWYIRERMTQSVVWHHISQLSPTKTNLFEAPPWIMRINDANCINSWSNICRMPTTNIDTWTSLLFIQATRNCSCRHNKWHCNMICMCGIDWKCYVCMARVFFHGNDFICAQTMGQRGRCCCCCWCHRVVLFCWLLTLTYMAYATANKMKHE